MTCLAPPDAAVVPIPDEVLAVATDWLSALPDEDRHRDVVREGLTTAIGLAPALKAALAGAGFEAWAAAVEALASQTDDQAAAARAATLLVHAAGDLAADGQHEALFARVDGALWLSAPGDGVDHLVARLARDPRAERLPDRLADWIDQQAASRMNARAVGLGAATDVRANGRYLWSGHVEAFLADSWACRVVASAWPDRFMAIVDRLGAPMAHAVIRAANLQSTTELAPLFAIAAEAFTDDGRPTGVAGLFALMESADVLIAASGEADFEASFAPVGDVLFARRDAGWAARAWLQRSIWLGRARRIGANDDRSAPARVQDALAARCRPLGREAIAWIEREDPLFRIHPILAECLVISAVSLTDAAELLAESVRRNLVPAHGRAEGLTSGTTEQRVVSGVLGGLADQAAWFENLWRDTYDARERAQFSLHSNVDSPATPLLAWGLQMLNRKPEDPALQAALVQWFLVAWTETRVTDPNAAVVNGELARLTVGAGIVLAARVASGDGAPSALEAFVAELFGPTPAFAMAVARMLASSPEDVIVAALRTRGAARVRVAIERAIAWAADHPKTKLLTPEDERLLYRLIDRLEAADVIAGRLASARNIKGPLLD